MDDACAHEMQVSNAMLNTGVLQIGSLLYVTASRSDVMFSIGMCARFQASPRESHLKATKRILRYLKHTQNVRLWYPKGARLELIGYSNSDYVGCKVEKKSTSGTCQVGKITCVLVIKEVK